MSDRAEETWRKIRAQYVRNVLNLFNRYSGPTVRDGHIVLRDGMYRVFEPSVDHSARYAVDYTLGRKPAHYPVPTVQVEYEYGRKLLPSGRWETVLITITRGRYDDV